MSTSEEQQKPQQNVVTTDLPVSTDENAKESDRESSTSKHTAENMAATVDETVDENTSSANADLTTLTPSTTDEPTSTTGTNEEQQSISEKESKQQHPNSVADSKKNLEDNDQLATLNRDRDHAKLDEKTTNGHGKRDIAHVNNDTEEETIATKKVKTVAQEEKTEDENEVKNIVELAAI
ncbi:unnamed protein product [Didymodactylos carnosus]|uniref:Uncharacterized protein n=1 Tax=Didymodactylos carnosus TaxID=1234261 RepID=A0A813T335_9BILA|nr:unnamed protein product [Didymodactylos carnosus]CAF0803568.1 unnamed protein product [Didymodactylos carnosus]CAF3512819.1 unnamed protein product [Didymodactylos carnosus]CAF3588822.1 unnamed protein product [Didymodactylos carnosus]